MQQKHSERQTGGLTESERRAVVERQTGESICRGGETE